ncbi:MAG TPA: dienelactone hydrolase family protein [Pyrinomonadaceae bacterium]|nr:dienelactone hydrolase family protein [Pyrinomonadaceae bacterium]
MTAFSRQSADKSQQLIGRMFVLALSVLLLPLFAAAQSMTDQHMNHMLPTTDSAETQDWARQRLSKSPRHQEWVKVKNGNREVNSFVVYPEVNKKATAVVVIHEIFGMTDWVQSLTDQLAEAGYIAIAPDLLSGMGPKGGGTSELAAVSSKAVGQAIGDLPPDQITSDLNAVADYVSKLPAANGKVVVTGYCWGGSQSFRFATNRPTLKAAFVFYGSAPTNNQAVDKEALAKIQAPVYGFYAGNDMRINATLPATIEAMKELKKTYDPVTYEGAGHGFMRAGDAPEPTPPVAKGDKEADDKSAAEYQKALTAYKANKKARDEAWVRWKEILAKL